MALTVLALTVLCVALTAVCLALTVLCLVLTVLCHLHRGTHVIRDCLIRSVTCIQGYLAQKKQPPPHRVTIGPSAWSYCRVLGVGSFL